MITAIKALLEYVDCLDIDRYITAQITNNIREMYDIMSSDINYITAINKGNSTAIVIMTLLNSINNTWMKYQANVEYADTLKRKIQLYKNILKGFIEMYEAK